MLTRHRSASALLATLTLAASASAQWVEVDAPWVAPVRELAPSPTVPGRVLASVAPTSPLVAHVPFPQVGSIALSSDGGQTWTRTTDTSLPFPVDVAWHPTDPDVVWCADGHLSSIAKSTNGGRTWSVVHTSPKLLHALAVDPQVPDRVYAVGAFLFDDAFHRSDDGGATWTSGFDDLFMEDVVVVPESAPGAVLVSAFGFGALNGVLRSSDGGASFTTVLPQVVARELIVAAGDPRVVWARTEPYEAPAQLFRSADGGRTWAEVPAPKADLVALAAHPTDPLRAWVASKAAGVLETVDGGASWSAGGAPPIGVGPTCLEVAPWDHETLLAGGDWGQGAVWRSEDGGAAWLPSGAGLEADVPGLRFDPHGRLFGFGLGLPAWRTPASGPWRWLPWQKKNAFVSSSLTVDPRDADTIALLAQLPSKGAHKVFRTHDGGASWENVNPPGVNAAAYAPLSVVHASDGVLYAPAKSDRLYRSEDAGATWTTLDTPGLTRVVPTPGLANVLHGTGPQGYARSLDGGRTWSTDAVGLDDVDDLTALEVDAQDPRFLAMLGDAAGFDRTLYVSRDGGLSWVAAGSGLPDDGATDLALDPHVSGRVLVATVADGVLLSSDHGATFSAFDGGLEGASVYSVAIDPAAPGSAWASTQGGGVWVAPLP